MNSFSILLLSKVYLRLNNQVLGVCLSQEVSDVTETLCFCGRGDQVGGGSQQDP